MITGRTPTIPNSSSNTHTEKFNPLTYNRPYSNTATKQQQPKTTKKVVDSIEESIIYGKLGDLIDSNSFVKPNNPIYQPIRDTGSSPQLKTPFTYSPPVYYQPSVNQALHQFHQLPPSAFIRR